MSEPPGYYLSPEKNSSFAIIALISGIFGVTLFPMIGSIVALITGQLAKREIDEICGTLGGKNLAQVGLILGWIGLVLALLGCCIVFAIIGCSFFTIIFSLGVEEFSHVSPIIFAV